jgi:cytochrome oxidase Cu insertion factor (SCO1/SenC/PrrC family)
LLRSSFSLDANGSGPAISPVDKAFALSRRDTSDADVDDLLREDGPAYTGLTSGQAEILRGSILLALASHELPDAASRYALDDIAAPHGAFAVAAAVRALRSSVAPLSEAAAAVLLRAAHQLANRDDIVVLPAKLGALEGESTSVMVEVLLTLAWLPSVGETAAESLRVLRSQSPPACSSTTMAELDRTLDALTGRVTKPCCSGSRKLSVTPTLRTLEAQLGDVKVEDQNSCCGDLGHFLGGVPALLAFFYTRCNNPEKCSLTITRLARVRQALERYGLGETANVFAVSYDPVYDTAERLRSYGAARGMVFSDRCRLLRTVGEFEYLRQALELRVGYGPAIVNSHAIELALLDGAGRAIRVMSGTGWDEEFAIALIKGAVAGFPPDAT